MEEAAPIFSFLSLSLFLSFPLPRFDESPKLFFQTPRENFVFSFHDIRLDIDFVRISRRRSESSESSCGGGGGEREGRSCRGEQVFYQTGCVPISRLVRTYRLVDTLADRRQLIKENSETICSREYPCRFLAVDF